MVDCKHRTAQDINKTRTCGAVREFIETVGSRPVYVQICSCACARRRGWQPMLNHRRATSPSNLPTLLHCRPSRLALCATGLEQLKLSHVLSQIILSPRSFLLDRRRRYRARTWDIAWPDRSRNRHHLKVICETISAPIPLQDADSDDPHLKHKVAGEENRLWRAPSRVLCAGIHGFIDVSETAPVISPTYGSMAALSSLFSSVGRARL